MNRRRFIQTSAIAGAGLLFSRLTFATANQKNLMNRPDEVWVLAENKWVSLTPHSDMLYSYQDIIVHLKQEGDAWAVFVASPVKTLSTVKLTWKHHIGSGTLVLGDHWERSYGDLGWKVPMDGRKYPWYVLLYDGQSTACFGVKNRLQKYMFMGNRQSNFIAYYGCKLSRWRCTAGPAPVKSCRDSSYKKYRQRNAVCYRATFLYHDCARRHA